MAPPTTLTIAMMDGSTTVVLSVPQVLRDLEAGNTGRNAVDEIIRSFFRAGCFFDSKNQKAYSTAQIKSITWS